MNRHKATTTVNWHSGENTTTMDRPLTAVKAAARWKGIRKQLSICSVSVHFTYKLKKITWIPSGTKLRMTLGKKKGTEAQTPRPALYPSYLSTKSAPINHLLPHTTCTPNIPTYLIAHYKNYYSRPPSHTNGRREENFSSKLI